MIKLTKRQKDILSLIQANILSHGSAPTRSEIAKQMGFRSPNAAEDHLRALAKKGAIELIPGTSRGIRLIKGPGLPIVGPVRGRNPILSDEHIIKYTTQIHRTLFVPPADYLMQITDTRLQEHAILSGDYLAVRQTNSVLLNQLAVLRERDGTVTIYRYSPELREQPLTIEGLVVGIFRTLAVPAGL